MNKKILIKKHVKLVALKFCVQLFCEFIVDSVLELF